MSYSNYLSRSEMAIVNLLTSALAWGWPVLLAFVTTPLIVRGLGNDAYGVRSLVVSITGYFAILDLGLNGAVTKYLAEYHVKNDKPQMAELLGTTLTTYTVFGLVGGVLIWVLAEWFATYLFTIPPQFQQESIWAFRLSGVGFFLSMITWWGSSIPTGIQRFDVFNGISIGFGTVTTLGSLAAVLLGYGLLGVVWANLLSNVIAIIAYWIAAHKLLPEILLRFSFQWEMFKRTVLFGLYMVAFRIFGLLFAQLDTLLIGTWIGTAAITFYMVPQQVAQLVHGINAKMMQIIFPMASEFSVTNDRQKLERMFNRGFNLSLVIGLTVAVPLAVVGKPLLHYWMSPEIANKSTVVLELLIITFFFLSLTAILSSIVAGMNYPIFVTISAIVLGVSSLACYTLLIKPFGIVGAAIGKLIGAIIMVLYYLVICRWKLRMSLSPLGITSVKTVGIGFAVGWLSYLFAVPLISSMGGVIFVAGLTAGAYDMLCWFLGVFEKEEKQSIIQLGKRYLDKAKV